MDFFVPRKFDVTSVSLPITANSVYSRQFKPADLKKRGCCCWENKIKELHQRIYVSETQHWSSFLLNPASASFKAVSIKAFVVFETESGCLHQLLSHTALFPSFLCIVHQLGPKNGGDSWNECSIDMISSHGKCKVLENVELLFKIHQSAVVLYKGHTKENQTDWVCQDQDKTRMSPVHDTLKEIPENSYKIQSVQVQS